MNRTVIALALPLLLAGCGSTAGAEPAPTPSLAGVTGTIDVKLETLPYLTGEQEAVDGGPCTPDDGYTDVRYGAQVTVTDAAGAVVGLGPLTGGTLNANGSTDLFDATCQFAFVVRDVPLTSEFYGVEVAGRGVQRYTAAQIQQPVALSLG